MLLRRDLQPGADVRIITIVPSEVGGKVRNFDEHGILLDREGITYLPWSAVGTMTFTSNDDDDNLLDTVG